MKNYYPLFVMSPLYSIFGERMGDALRLFNSELKALPHFRL